MSVPGGLLTVHPVSEKWCRAAVGCGNLRFLGHTTYTVSLREGRDFKAHRNPVQSRTWQRTPAWRWKVRMWVLTRYLESALVFALVGETCRCGNRPQRQSVKTPLPAHTCHQWVLDCRPKVLCLCDLQLPTPGCLGLMERKLDLRSDDLQLWHSGWLASDGSLDLLGPCLPFIGGRITLIYYVTPFTEILDIVQVISRSQSPYSRYCWIWDFLFQPKICTVMLPDASTFCLWTLTQNKTKKKIWP